MGNYRLDFYYAMVSLQINEIQIVTLPSWSVVNMIGRLYGPRPTVVAAATMQLYLLNSCKFVAIAFIPVEFKMTSLVPNPRSVMVSR